MATPSSPSVLTPFLGEKEPPKNEWDVLCRTVIDGAASECVSRMEAVLTGTLDPKEQHRSSYVPQQFILIAKKLKIGEDAVKSELQEVGEEFATLKRMARKPHIKTMTAEQHDGTKKIADAYATSKAIARLIRRKIGATSGDTGIQKRDPQPSDLEFIPDVNSEFTLNPDPHPQEHAAKNGAPKAPSRGVTPPPSVRKPQAKK